MAKESIAKKARCGGSNTAAEERLALKTPQGVRQTGD